MHRMEGKMSLLESVLPVAAFRLCICRVRSESEAQEHMRRRRKRKREKISKAQDAADPAEVDSQAASLAAEGGDDAAGKEEEDEKLTAADELAPMQVSS